MDLYDHLRRREHIHIDNELYIHKLEKNYGLLEDLLKTVINHMFNPNMTTSWFSHLSFNLLSNGWNSFLKEFFFKIFIYIYILEGVFMILHINILTSKVKFTKLLMALYLWNSQPTSCNQWTIYPKAILYSRNYWLSILKWCFSPKKICWEHLFLITKKIKDNEMLNRYKHDLDTK